MPWYVWLLGGVVAFVALTVATLLALRASERGRAFLRLRSRAKLAFGKALLRDPAVPLRAKAILLLVVAYLAMPFDLIPDFIPVLGQADDIAVIVMGVALAVVLVPRDRFEAALLAAEAAYPR
jgi:uncharacterized membrane protein YkvA (DUF1232 family)